MDNLKFTPTHEWLNNQQNEFIIGITEHAQQLLGDMVFIELPTIGKVVSAGDELGVLESVKAASDFYAPISGVVTAINEAVLANPALVNTAPYTQGWLVKLQPGATCINEINNLLNYDKYKAQIAEEH